MVSAKNPRGELRRRLMSSLRSGILSAVGSQGRIMFSYLQMFADYETCRVRVSARGAAELLHIPVTCARLGMLELERMRVIECTKRGVGGKRSEYEIRNLPKPGEANHPRLLEAVTYTKLKRMRNRLEKVSATDNMSSASQTTACNASGAQAGCHRQQPRASQTNSARVSDGPLQLLSIDTSSISIERSNFSNDPVGSLQKEIVVETTLPAEREEQAQTKASGSTLTNDQGMTRLRTPLDNASDSGANLRALSEGLSLAAREKQEELDELVDRHERRKTTKDIQELTNEAQNRMQALEALRLEKDRWEIQILG